MSVNQIRLKLLGAAERLLRGWADHLSSIAPQPRSDGGPPQDWLDRVKRAGRVVGHNVSMPVDLPPDVRAEDDSGILQPPVRSSDLSLETVETTPSHSSPPSSPQPVSWPSSPASPLPKWRRPLKLRPPVYPHSPVRDIPVPPGQKSTTPPNASPDSASRGLQHETAADSVQFPAGAESPMKTGVLWRRQSVPRTETKVEFPKTVPTDAESDIHYAEMAEPVPDTISWNSIAASQHATKVNYGRKSRSVERAIEFNFHKPAPFAEVEFNPPRAIPAPVALELQASKQNVQDAAYVEAYEPPIESWPQLPQEGSSVQDTEIRIGRLIEDRARLDREQNGLTWNARRF